jgi:hypothetical protein
MTRRFVLGAVVVGFVLGACNVHPTHASATISFKSGGPVLHGAAPLLPGLGTGSKRCVGCRELLPNPKNWRRRPKAQTEALRDLLVEIGYADALIARELQDGIPRYR